MEVTSKAPPLLPSVIKTITSLSTIGATLIQQGAEAVCCTESLTCRERTKLTTLKRLC